MTGFQAPNYTQVPNDFFEMMPTMGEAELRIMLFLMRATFGYHRAQYEITIRDLADATALSTASIQAAAARLEERGIVRRIVVANKPTVWECVVESDTPLYQNLIRGVSVATANLGLKKEKERHTFKKEKRTAREKLAAFLKEVGQ